MKAITVIVFTLFLLSFLHARAEAIPAFSRKYKTSCTTCHSVSSKLNSFGEAFRRNGYQIPEIDERYVKEKPVSLGAPAWKEVWPEGIWPGDMPGTAPFSLLATGLYRYEEDSPVKYDFTFPSRIKFLSAGTLGQDISFWGSIALIQNGNDFGGMERLFLRFDNLFDDSLPAHFFNITIGQFEPAAAPFSIPRRLTHTLYLINTFKVGKNNFNLSSQRGAEIDGIVKSRFDYAVGIVNGNGTGKMDNSTHSLDNNSAKDTYLRIGYKFGGVGLDGTGISVKDETALPEVGPERFIHISVLGYRGENRVSDAGSSWDDQFYRYGLAIDLNYDSINLFGAIIQGGHDNPRGDLKQTSVTSYFSEADFLLYPWLVGILRYGVADVEYEKKKDEVVVSFVALIRANVKLTLEGVLHTTGGESDLGLMKLDFVL